MSRFSLRRLVASTAVLATAVGLTLVGPAAASADDAHPSSNSIDTSNLTITKSVVGDGTAAAGGKATFRTTIAATNTPVRSIEAITDHHPAGFEYVHGSAKVNAFHLIGGQKTESVSPTVNVNDRTVTVHGVWPVDTIGSKTVTLEVSYLVPDDAAVGTYLETSSDVDVAFFNTLQTVSGAWVQIREKNLGENVTSGSAGAGLGSSDGEGGSGSAALSDPASFIGDVISRVLQNGS
ncbi:hypothetical protein [Rhodococcus sp. NPDC058521]|uniref:hypothetical protein n=1 Tax=Rhodococcus sp. NPDC058521 TaxID=3346536 RepID=UPI003667796F